MRDLNPETTALLTTGLRDSALKALAALTQVIVGKDSHVRRALAVLLSGGHLLLEDLPGVGKTTLARGLALVLGGRFQRVQGTNDLLPSDLLGAQLWDAREQIFRFQPGPVFANVLLLDELNRIGPKTQSALLEVMVEGQVTMDHATHPLPDPFFVIATQNPTDHAGTFPLPESQMDRFAAVLHLGYPPPEAERRILKGEAGSIALDSLEMAMSPADWAAAKRAVRQVNASDAVLGYIERVVERIRNAGGFCSTRAISQWLALAKAEAWLQCLPYVTPDHLQATLSDTMAHRGRMDDRVLNRQDRRHILENVIAEVPVGWKP
ncbi:MAG: AAA family ATPase [Holophagales bacterium]|jgi:MoxR-like ATPase|nr:AAA family ATPase [Holophagales bacterium]